MATALSNSYAGNVDTTSLSGLLDEAVSLSSERGGMAEESLYSGVNKGEMSTLR